MIEIENDIKVLETKNSLAETEKARLSVENKTLTNDKIVLEDEKKGLILGDFKTLNTNSFRQNLIDAITDLINMVHTTYGVTTSILGRTLTKELKKFENIMDSEISPNITVGNEFDNEIKNGPGYYNTIKSKYIYNPTTNKFEIVVSPATQGNIKITWDVAFGSILDVILYGTLYQKPVSYMIMMLLSLLRLRFGNTTIANISITSITTTYLVTRDVDEFIRDEGKKLVNFTILETQNGKNYIGVKKAAQSIADSLLVKTNFLKSLNSSKSKYNHHK